MNVIITFCGHASFSQSLEYEKQILAFLEDKIGDKVAEAYLGGYGNFDEFAYQCCKKYQATHPNLSLVFVTPYITVEYQRNHLKELANKYDSIIYPEIENKPLRFAITYRNRYMVEKSDYVISHIDHKWGGAYSTYKYAKQRNKKILNLGVLKE